MKPDRTTLREAIIACARKQDSTIGDDAMVAPCEWGYWVGSTVYVRKGDVSRALQADYDKKNGSLPKEGNR